MFRYKRHFHPKCRDKGYSGYVTIDQHWREIMILHVSRCALKKWFIYELSDWGFTSRRTVSFTEKYFSVRILKIKFRCQLSVHIRLYRYYTFSLYASVTCRINTPDSALWEWRWYLTWTHKTCCVICIERMNQWLVNVRCNVWVIVSSHFTKSNFHRRLPGFFLSLSNSTNAFTFSFLYYVVRMRSHFFVFAM
jgi:hypothetical protein